MARTRAEILAGLPPARRARIEVATAERIAEVEGLRALRKLAGHSQAYVARALGVKQPAVAQMEKRTDVYLSTLRQYIEAAGGRLDLIVEMPGLEPVRLTGFGDLSRDDEAA
ncbi:MAG: helix-turn-helix domain-containing protein [Caulobacter sp.]